MDYLLHSILHILVGLCIGYFFLSKDVESNRDQIFVLTISGIASIAPDITKFFGDLYGHSIWFVPVFGLLMALVSRWFFKKIDWVKLWIVFSVVIFIGHLLIDFIGNGLALYYPSTMKEFRFHIIRSVDYFILTLLFITITLSFFFEKEKVSDWNGFKYIIDLPWITILFQSSVRTNLRENI